MDTDTDLNNVPIDAESEITPKDRLEGCPFCLIAEGKIDTNIVYSDDKFLGILDINPANPGHILLFPKLHYTSLADMSEDSVSRIFVVANKLCKIVSEILHAKGFNIFLADGTVAGQNVPHVILHLIPRFDKDGINFAWKPKPMSVEYMKNIADLIKSSPIKEKEHVPEVFYEPDEDERVA